MTPPFWRDGSGNLRPSIPAPDAGRDVPIYDDFRLVDLKRLGWSLFTPPTYGTGAAVPRSSCRSRMRRLASCRFLGEAFVTLPRSDRPEARAHALIERVAALLEACPACSGNLRSRESQWRRRRRLRGTHASPFATPCTLHPKGSPS